MSPREAIEAERARRETQRSYAWALALAALAVALGASADVTGFDLGRLIEGVPRTIGFFEAAAPDLRPGALLAGQDSQGSLAAWFYAGPLWARLLWQSIEMAILASALGSAAAFALAFLAARPTAPSGVVRFAAKRLLELCRTIPDIVLALVFVFAFGIGPAAGVLAIAIHTAGALGKLFSEVIDNVDRRPLDGVRAAGGTLFDVARYGAVPQTLASFASYALLRFEINVGSAAVIGVVGAGGIGEEFRAALDFYELRSALAIMLMTAAVIFLIDLVSEAVRHRLIGLRA